MGQVKAAEKNFAAVEALINDMESAECPIQLKVLKLMNKYGQLCGKQVDFAYFLIAEPLFWFWRQSMVRQKKYWKKC